MTEVLWRPLSDAFLGVGVFVALLVAPFGWARLRWGRAIDDALVRHRRLAPLAGAALTLPPGCGGAILVATLYGRGGVTYGTAVAALVATMGDASWVLLAADPWLTLQLKLLLVVVGTTTGYVVDALGIDPRRDRAPAPPAQPAQPALPAQPAQPALPAVLARLDAPQRVGALALAPLAVLWGLLGAGAALSLPATFRLLDPAAVGSSVGLPDPALLLGCTGTLAAVGYLWLHRGRDCTGEPTGLRDVFRSGAHDVATVTAWVAVAFVGWAVLEAVTGLHPQDLPLVGVTGVVVAALVGLVPGCALQIVFCGVFVAGGMPLPTLVANMVSQDGDALIPMLALQPRSALLAGAITTAPALLVGGLLLLLT
ncbi:putative manganese transporter [Nocardioides zeae]|uniref:Arsenic efflux protein n=1 Tax=Nocardioides zeae TaxID=1457234 RepID=A0AAJ1X086_9ACTN|nr:putative manganese transporter [Nocardioides zeae]MDQ1103521.1 hypothetical protein [Nocardioides zeae]